MGVFVSVNYGTPNYRPQVDFSWLSDGWNLFKQQSTTWVLTILLASIVDGVVTGTINTATGLSLDFPFNHRGATSINFGNFLRLDSPIHTIASFVEAVVGGVLSGSLYRMAIRQVRGETLSPADLFKIGDVLVPLIGLSAITWVCMVPAFALCIVPGLILSGLFMFAPLFVVGQGVGPLEAISRSVSTLKDQWVMAASFFTASFLLVLLSFLLCCVGEFAVIPQFVLAIAVGFTRFMGSPGPTAQMYAGPTSPGTWPPAPSAPQSPYGQPQGSVLDKAPYGQPPADPMPGQPAAPGAEPPVQRAPPQPPRNWHGRVDDTWVDMPAPDYDKPGGDRQPGDSGQS